MSDLQFLQKKNGSSFLLLGALLLGAAAIFWICTFKLMDRDFWWHITAGKLMMETGGLILTEPFSYTREGLPYLASYEWLAQILLRIIYDLTGSTGMILFRGVVACICMGLLLSLTKKIRIPYLLLAVWAVVITKGSFLERPQLFTFLCFAASIVLAFRFLDASTQKSKIRICAGMVLVQLFWVNTHGGAALLNCVLLTFLLLQLAVDAWKSYDRTVQKRDMLLLGTTIFVMGIVFILPPNGLKVVEYVKHLLTDQTIAFIAEWQPRTLGLYLKELWPFIALSISALWLGRRHWIWNGLLLLSMAYLSRQAFRHEILFVFAAVATCLYQFDRSVAAEKFWAWTKRHARISAIALLLLVLILGRIAYIRSVSFERQDNLFGFGQFDLAKGAADFLEQEKIEGNMFNTYGIGGYLMYRGYPDRKVFIDGRNVDYGFEFMARAYAAGLDRDRWDDLAQRFNFSYAVVDYDAIKEKDGIPYIQILERHPDWALVYMDDWVAVYLKRNSTNRDLITRLEYKQVRVSDIEFRRNLLANNEAELPSIIAELRRAQKSNPKSVKATLGLASIAEREQRVEDAMALANLAREIRPNSPEPIEILATIAIGQKEIKTAAGYYTELLRLAGDQYPDIDYGFIANVYEKAGWTWRARFLRFWHGGQASQKPSDSNREDASPAVVNPQTDALEFHDRALQLIQEERFDEAEEAFLTSLKINPGFSDAWSNLCALQLDLKKNDEALQSCSKAIELNAEFGDAHYNLAIALYRQKEWDKALEEAELAKKFGRAPEAEALIVLLKKQRQ